ncbi:Tripartite tricarboxylate transporter substrate binding protein [Bordetella sputigena]|uniref:tripartite tricarboxylate transporter substrate binding protein n=1 Tax=Bordetella sputigena TaxID=1416810 RepID=UPI0039EF3580
MNFHPHRRSLFAAAIAAHLLAHPLIGWAQKADYPNHAVRVIVPFVPGGNADSSARIFAEAYGKQLGQSFIVENKGGAGGMIGATTMVRAAPDGYTIMIGTTGPIVASWQLAGKAASYSLKDMKPVALLTQVPGVIVTKADSPLKSYADLVAYAKTHPGALKFGHPGNGTAGHVNILQMQKALSQQFVIAAYRGAGPAVQDLLGGQLDAVATDLPSALQLIKAGQLHALAVVFPQRVPSLPDVATMAELKQPEVDIAPFTATMAPKDVPPEVIARLVAASNTALDDPAVRKRVEDIGGVPVKMSGAEFDTFLDRQVETYRALIASGLLTAD